MGHTTRPERAEALLRETPAFIALLDAMQAVADIQRTPRATRTAGGEVAQLLRDTAQLRRVSDGASPLSHAQLLRTRWTNAHGGAAGAACSHGRQDAVPLQEDQTSAQVTSV